MSYRPILTFFWYTLGYAWAAAWRAAFGWAGPIGGGVVAAVGPRLFPGIEGSGWEPVLWQGLTVGLASLGSMFVIFLLFVAPVKAYRRLNPIVVKVNDRLRSPGLVSNEFAKGYNVNLIIRNRSDVGLLDCTVHVHNMIFRQGQAPYSRFVQKFDLPAKTQRVIPIAHWFSREPPNRDDTEIAIEGPVDASFGGNWQTVPLCSPPLVMTVAAPACRQVNVKCRVWADKAARVLRAELIPD